MRWAGWASGQCQLAGALLLHIFGDGTWCREADASRSPKFMQRLDNYSDQELVVL